MSGKVVQINILKVIINALMMILFICLVYRIDDYYDVFKRGLVCDDTSLMYPYKKAIYPGKIINYTGMCPNFLVILLIEFLNRQQDTREIRLRNIKIPNWIYNSLCVIGVYVTGDHWRYWLVYLMKLAVGRFRPFFIAFCKPDVCMNTNISMSVYFTTFKCTNPKFKPKHEISGRTSFPSAHSSGMMFYMMFMAMYLYRRLAFYNMTSLRLLLAFICITHAIYVGASRISDYKNHWSDVICGFTMGIITAIVTVKFCCVLFPSDEGDHSEPVEIVDND